MYSAVDSAISVENKEYGQLLSLVQPRKIESKQDYERSVALLESLLEEEEEEGISQQEETLVELLVVLVQDYERENVNVSTPEPLAVLIHLMEAGELKQSDLVGVLGSSGIVSEVINGKREISKTQARSLGKFFGLSYRLFL